MNDKINGFGNGAWKNGMIEIKSFVFPELIRTKKTYINENIIKELLDDNKDLKKLYDSANDDGIWYMDRFILLQSFFDKGCIFENKKKINQPIDKNIFKAFEKKIIDDDSKKIAVEKSVEVVDCFLNGKIYTPDEFKNIKNKNQKDWLKHYYKLIDMIFESDISIWIPELGIENKKCDAMSEDMNKQKDTIPLNQIFYGPPGTGKTYKTINSALEILEPKYPQENEERSKLKEKFDKYVKNGRIGFITFHQSFSYEDFVEGLRAEADDKGNIQYSVQDGIFKQLCDKAKNLSEHDKGNDETNKEPVVLIIDEINRGNTANIFGELITLIEPSKRMGATESLSVVLPYSKKIFSVPDNLYIIGTMNTADRSLSLIDTALRRRFQFQEMLPKPELLPEINIKDIDLKKLLTIMNQRISLLYDREHTLGHSFFMSLDQNSTIYDLNNIFTRQILPLLEEYFFEDWEKIRQVLGDTLNKDEDLQIIKKEIEEADVLALLGNNHNNSMLNSLYTRNDDALNKAETYIAIYKRD